MFISQDVWFLQRHVLNAYNRYFLATYRTWHPRMYCWLSCFQRFPVMLCSVCLHDECGIWNYSSNVILSFSALTELWSQVIMAAPHGQNYAMNQGQYPPNYYPPQQPGYYQPPPQGQYAPHAYYQVGKKCWNMLSFTPSVETVLFSYITISSCKSHWVIVTGCIEYVYFYKNWT